jgi:hypothetical protein
MLTALYIDGDLAEFGEDAPEIVRLEFDTDFDDEQDFLRPLSWCNSATIHADEVEDSVTVAISVGDPRGAFTFIIRRVPQDVKSDLAGQLIMHVPYIGESRGHMELTPLHEGTYAVGSYTATGRKPYVPAAA